MKMSCLVFVISVLSLNICYAVATGNDQLIYISPEQITSMGDNITLDCTVQLPLDVPLMWIKHDRDRRTGQVVLSVNENLMIRESRFKLAVKNDTIENKLTLSLKITNIQIRDAGVYDCEYNKDLTKKITKNVEVQVRSPPRIMDEYSTLQLKIKEGDNAALNCHAEGYPRPDITWTRQSGAIMPQGGTSVKVPILNITKADKRDRGIYYCTAHNNIGEPAQRSVSLQVEFAPSISVLRPKVAQARDYSIDLECNIFASPAPQILWTKNGVELYNDGYHEITHFGTVNDLTLSKIKIVSVNSKNYGEYKCAANNQHGSAESTIQLYESAIPVPYSLG